jgi:Flp pilus assembly protein TadD
MGIVRSILLSLLIFVVAGCGGGAGQQPAQSQSVEQRLSVLERALVNQMRINKDQEERIIALEKEVMMRVGSGK